MDFQIIILLLYFSLTYTQLTKGEISYIKNYILNNQNKQNGLFFEGENSMKFTRQAIESLLILGEEIPKKNLICETLLNNKNANYDILKINSDLKCQRDFSSRFKQQIQLKNYIMILKLLNY